MIIFYKFSPHKEKEDKDFNTIHSQSGKNFSKWELFTRMNEVKTLVKEKETRDEIYEIIKNKIKSLKESSGKFLNQEEIKSALFGENLPLIKLQQDASIPPQHYFNLYIKAAQGEPELDRFYKKSNSFLKYQITEAKQQVELLRNKLENKKMAKTYERRNFYNYYDKFGEDYEKLKKDNKENLEIREELHNYKKAVAQSREAEFKELVKSAQFLKEVDIYTKKKGYDVFNLNSEQVNDLNKYRQTKIYEEQVKEYFLKEKEREYVDYLRRDEMTHKLKKKIDKLNEELKPLKEGQKVFRPTYKGETIPTLNEQDYLSQAELNLDDLEAWKSIVDKSTVDQMLLKEKKTIDGKALWKKRETYESLLWRFHDRQVKKTNKPRLWAIKDAREELFALEKERENNEAEETKKQNESLDNLRHLH